MASKWAQTQRDGWLCDLYGKENEDGARVLPPKSIQHQLLNVLEGLLSLDTPPSDAAAQTASLIITQKDINTPWSNHIGMYYDAVRNFDDEKVLRALVDYLAELASLPDAINEGPKTKIIWTSLGNRHIEPGQPIFLDEGKLWSDLPEFSWNLTELLQGKYKCGCSRMQNHSDQASRTRAIPTGIPRAYGTSWCNEGVEEPQYLPRD